MNLGQIWAECGRLLGDPNNERWVQSVLTLRANLAQTEIQGYTNAVKTSESITTTAGTSAVMLDADTMDVLRATYADSSGNILPLPGISREELDYRYPTWKQWDDGQPQLYWWDATNLQLNLVPTPSSQWAFSLALTVWESRKPGDMASSTDIPFDSSSPMAPYSMAIVHWVVAQCYMDDGTPEALGKAQFHKSGSLDHPGQYENHIQRILSEFDAPEDVPTAILWKPQGGRLGGWGFPTKSDPLTW